MSNETTSPDDKNGDVSQSQQLRELLTLEIEHVRRQADAARLEARLAELRLKLGKIGVSADAPHIPPPTPMGSPIEPSPADSRPVDPATRPVDPATRPVDSASLVQPFTRWDQVAGVLSIPSTHPDAVSKRPPALPPGLRGSQGSPVHRRDWEFTREVSDAPIIRVDPPHPLRGPVLLDAIADGRFVDDRSDHSHDDSSTPVIDENVDFVSSTTSIARDGIIDQSSADDGALSKTFESSTNVSVESDEEPSDAQRRPRPMPLVISAVVHAAVLLILGLVTFQAHVPRDQVALTASPEPEQATEVQTFEIETVEMETESVAETSEAMTEVAYEDLGGELPAIDVATPSPTTSLASLAQATSATQSLASLSGATSDSEAVQFCGVSGGGNHFVYLVDSSGSMGDAFTSARRELLDSIDALKPDQRFYVIFFDESSEHMRISDPNRDEPRSVKATPQNKSAIRRWAMTIEKNRGQNPYDDLQFALKLRPDVIFLLSDGEFPERIETLLQRENRVENLFGDSKPISIVHTIGYHSREGETRMKRIARDNMGQYRHIPKPR